MLMLLTQTPGAVCPEDLEGVGDGVLPLPPLPDHHLVPDVGVVGGGGPRGAEQVVSDLLPGGEPHLPAPAAGQHRPQPDQLHRVHVHQAELTNKCVTYWLMTIVAIDNRYYL